MVSIRSPQAAVFDQLLIYSKQIGNEPIVPDKDAPEPRFKSYDYLPLADDNASLPFVYLGEQFSQDRRTKRVLYGDMQQTIHIYGGYRQHREVRAILDELKLKIINMNKIGEMNIDVKRTTTQIIHDNSTTSTLLHGILEIELVFN